MAVTEKGTFLVIIALLGMAHTIEHFGIEDQIIGDLHTKVLWNTKTGEYVQIITDLGGRVEDTVMTHCIVLLFVQFSQFMLSLV